MTGDSEHQEPLPRFPALLHAGLAPLAPAANAGQGMLVKLLEALAAAHKQQATPLAKIRD